jgi:hypothetical protein
MFRLRVLLMLVPVLLVVTIAVAIDQKYGFLYAALMVLVAQTILQASYFVGLVLAAATSPAEQRRDSDYTELRTRSASSRRGPFHGF